jgi:hypothetical protein
MRASTWTSSPASPCTSPRTSTYAGTGCKLHQAPVTREHRGSAGPFPVHGPRRDPASSRQPSPRLQNDGPPPTGLLTSHNSAALRFHSPGRVGEGRYGKYLKLFGTRRWKTVPAKRVGPLTSESRPELLACAASAKLFSRCWRQAAGGPWPPK